MRFYVRKRRQAPAVIIVALIDVLAGVAADDDLLCGLATAPLVLGIGIGGPLAVYGALLHLINNGLTKGVLFLSAGNIHRA